MNLWGWVLSTMASAALASLDQHPSGMLEDSALAPFARLDAFIDRALTAVKPTSSPQGTGDFRGLHADPVQSPEWDGLLVHPGWRWLQETYGLSKPELDTVLITLAPEVDLRYERLYGYLCDEVQPSGASVDLVLGLLYDNAEAKLAGRALFRATSPLFAGRVLRLVPDPNRFITSLLAQRLRVDPQVSDVLLGQHGLDDRLASWCSLTPVSAAGSPLELAPPQWNAICRLAEDPMAQRRLRLNFHGSPGSGRQSAAAALARHLRMPLLVADLRRVLERQADLAELLPVVFREAELHGALLVLEGVEPARSATSGDALLLEKLLAEHSGPLIVAGREAWLPGERPAPPVIDVAFTVGGVASRCENWRRELAGVGTQPAREELEALGSRFRLGPGPIANAVAAATTAARLRGDASPTTSDLFAAARHQTASRLSDVARQVPGLRGWDELVLPEDSCAQLKELTARVAFSHLVWQDWGLQAATGATGVAALFTGPPGTGKTMAAQVIATDLGLDLFAIDLSMVVSKYIGETEKNLERLFEAATDSNAVLFFDEADALFGKRTLVRDAHDRYANVETSYLLQRMERHEGVAILATNLRQNLDDAFIRRLHFIVDFPLPEPAHRRRLWGLHLPSGVPIDPTLDLDDLADRYPLSGAGIRNVTVHAAFLAAADGGPIGLDQLRRALTREYQKSGRVLVDFRSAPSEQEG